MAKNVRVKVGNGNDTYAQLPFLGRTLTKKEKNYVVNKAINIVINYFKENTPETSLTGETDEIAKTGSENNMKYLSPRTYSPVQGDDVINIKDDIITSNYQYKKVAVFEWGTLPDDITSVVPEITYYTVRYWIDKETLFYSETVISGNYAKGPDSNPEKDDLIFVKWKFNPKPITADTDIYAMWLMPDALS